LSGTEDLDIVERVGKLKSKKTKLSNYTPSDPIKTTHELNSSKLSDNFSEQQLDSPCSKKQGVTAVMAVMMVEPQRPTGIVH
jgi:hypothetical protein